MTSISLRLAAGAALFLGTFQVSPDVAFSAQKETLTIGAALSRTGEHSVNGKHSRRGYELARKMVNEKGGIKVGDKTYTLKIKYYDDESNPNIAAKFAKRLITKDKVPFLLGPYSSAITDKVAEVAEKYRIPMVQGNGAANAIFDKGYKYTFGVLSPADQYLTEALKLASEQALKAGKNPASLKVAIAVENDIFSSNLRDGVVAEGKKRGMSIVVDEKLPRDYGDMTFVLDKVKAKKPDILVVSGHEGGAKLAVRQIYEQKIDVPMLAMTHCEAADIEGKYGLRANNTLCATQWSGDTDYSGKWFGDARNYDRRYQAQHGIKPPYQAAESSAAVLVLADAIERAGSLSGDKVRDALSKTDLKTFFGWVKFDSSGKNVAKPMILRQLVQGRYLVVAPSGMAKHQLVYPRPKWSER